MEHLEWAVGRRKKFGEASGFVTVRVPKSKVSEYRAEINKLVDDKFSRDSSKLHKEEDGREKSEEERVVFRDFREFRKDVKERVSKPVIEDDFFTKIVKDVDNRGKNGKKIK